MAKYQISVIIPTYNSEKFLDGCIQSLINQSFGFENIEVIFADDGSNDSTPEILRDYSNRFENVTAIFSEKNTGSPSKPRNMGIENATSDYIMFMDHDDRYFPEMCEVMYEGITAENVDIVTCRLVFNRDNKELIRERMFLDELEDVVRIDSPMEMPQIMTSSHPGFIWNKIFKRELINRKHIRFPEDALYEDICFMVLSYLNAEGILLLNDFWGYCYVVRTEGENKSTSEVFDDEKLLMRLRGLEVILKELDECEVEFPSLEGEMIAGWVKNFLFTNPKSERSILQEAEKHYRRYKWNTRIFTIGLAFNILLNVFMVLFRSSVSFAIFAAEFYNLLVRLGIASKSRRNS